MLEILEVILNLLGWEYIKMLALWSIAVSG